MSRDSSERDQALEDLQAIKATYGQNGTDCRKQEDYLSAAWSVVSLNMRLIYWALRPMRAAKEYDDLVGELAITLFNACYNWDPSLGKFSTYAVACIRYARLVHASELRQLDLAVRLPQYLQTEGERARFRARIIASVEELRGSYAEARDSERINPWWERQARLDQRLRTLDSATDFSTGRVRHTRRFRDEDGFVSREAPEVEFIADEDSPSTEDAAILGVLRDALQQGLSSLRDREQLVLQLLYGLNREVPMSLSEVGRELGVTRERVRQIQMRALRKLRHPRRSIWFRDFI